MISKLTNYLHKLENKYNLGKNDLVAGLAVGLVAGLAGGLVWGLVWGLGSLISVSLIASIKYFPRQAIIFWITLVLVFIIFEFIFLKLDKAKPKKNDNVLWFTAKRKGIALLESLFVVLEINGLFQLSIRGYPYIRKYFPEILKWTGYIGIGIIALAILIGLVLLYLYVNSLKYRR